MKIAGLLLGAGVLLATLPVAQAVPVPAPSSAKSVTEVQLDCIGPSCLTTGPIRRPYLRGTTPPGTEWFRRTPPPPAIKLQQPEMDYRVPRVERDKPLVREIRPPDPSYHVIGEPQQHIQWCSERYRSYRESDNTYQPFSGPRKQCRSPYN